jgi:hypothetical protein
MNAAVGADERLVVMLEARISEFEKRMAKAEGRGTRTYQNLRRASKSATAQMEADMNRASGRINGALSGITGQIGTFGKAFVGGLAVGAITTALGAITTNLRATLRGIAEVGDSAKRSGLGVEAFQEWSYVADQNRVSIDALVDGFKELSLRADEWIVTGGGSAADAFKRLGFSAADLKERLKDPSALMLEIVSRLQNMDKAAQIRISDELFGGTGGEQFVQLLEKGEAGLRATIDRAHEVGRVMDEELIAKAQELDIKWAALTDRISTFAKTAAVALADLPFAIVESRINEIFDEAEGRHILGDEIYDQLETVGDLSDEQVDKLQGLKGEWQTLGEEARRTANAMAQAAGEADMYGLDALWEVLASTSQEMRQLADDFDAGAIDGETFRTKLDELQRTARGAFDTLDDADRVNFSGAISEVERLGGVVAAVAGKVSELYGWLKAAAGMGDSVAIEDDRGAAIKEAAAGSLANSSMLAPKASTRPRARPFELGVPDPDTGSGGGGGGGGRSQDEFAEAIAQIERETAALQAETAAYLEVAAAGTQYGDMAEYARTKAELLTAAQEQGLQITPELTAQIEAQARAYATAGAEAAAAADRMEEVEKASERGADAIGGIFVAALDGADAAKKAVADLIGEIARMMMMRGAIELIEGMGGGGVLSTVGGWLSGARASGGGVQRGGAYLVNEGTPRSEVFVPSQNGAILNVQQAQAALRGQSGGQQSVKVDVTVHPSPEFHTTVRKEARGAAADAVRQGIGQYDRQLPDRIAQYTRDPKARK